MTLHRGVTNGLSHLGQDFLCPLAALTKPLEQLGIKLCLQRHEQFVHLRCQQHGEVFGACDANQVLLSLHLSDHCGGRTCTSEATCFICGFWPL